LIYVSTMRKIQINKGNLIIKDQLIGFFEKEIVPHGNGAKVLCPKEHIGKKVYVLIRE
jgi:putative transposon-encoded protein